MCCRRAPVIATDQMKRGNALSSWYALGVDAPCSPRMPIALAVPRTLQSHPEQCAVRPPSCKHLISFGILQRFYVTL
jgi:hypothetical protein